jgi:hypothetical protein
MFPDSVRIIPRLEMIVVDAEHILARKIFFLFSPQNVI